MLRHIAVIFYAVDADYAIPVLRARADKRVKQVGRRWHAPQRMPSSFFAYAVSQIEMPPDIHWRLNATRRCRRHWRLRR